MPARQQNMGLEKKHAKRPRNAYLKFMEDYVKNNGQNKKTFSEALGVISEGALKWKEMDSQEKALWHQKVKDANEILDGANSKVKSAASSKSKSCKSKATAAKGAKSKKKSSSKKPASGKSKARKGDAVEMVRTKSVESVKVTKGGVTTHETQVRKTCHGSGKNKRCKIVKTQSQKNNKGRSQKKKTTEDN